MPLTNTFTAGYGGTMTVGGTIIPVQNVTVDLSRGEIDVTATTDLYQKSMAGRISRRVSCTALVNDNTETAVTAMFNSAINTSVTLSWSDGNGSTFSLTKVMVVSASRSYDNSGACTIAFTFAESF